MSKFNCVQHFVFRDFLCEPLHHDDLTFVSGNDHVQVAVFELSMGWKRYKLSINAADTGCGDRASERKRTNEQGASTAIHGEHVSIILHIAT